MTKKSKSRSRSNVERPKRLSFSLSKGVHYKESRGVFGLDLDEEQQIPRFLFHFFRYIEANLCKGIYRKSGLKKTQLKMIETIEKGKGDKILDGKEFKNGKMVHEVAGVVKGYFSRMSMPMLDESKPYYEPLMKAVGIEDRVERSQTIRKIIVEGCTKTVQIVLLRLMKNCKILKENEKLTLMGAKNSAIIFCPHLFTKYEYSTNSKQWGSYENKLVVTMINDYELIFTTKEKSKTPKKSKEGGNGKEDKEEEKKRKRKEKRRLKKGKKLKAIEEKKKKLAERKKKLEERKKEIQRKKNKD